MNKENCALKLVDEIILYYDARSKKNVKLKLLSFAKRREFHDICKNCETVQGTAISHVVFLLVR